MSHVRILQAFACYHAYGDAEGLDDDEVAAYDRRFGECGRIFILPNSEEEFALCELTRQWGATMMVEALQPGDDGSPLDWDEDDEEWVPA